VKRATSLARRNADSPLAAAQPAAPPAERRHVLMALIAAYFGLGRWAECRAVLDEATSLGDVREWLTLSEFGQFGEIEELQDAHERYAYALLRCGEPGQALNQLDLGKTRAQRDWLGAETGQPRHEPVDPRPLVPAGGALVFPVVTPRGTAVWILTRDPAEPAPQGADGRRERDDPALQVAVPPASACCMAAQPGQASGRGAILFRPNGPWYKLQFSVPPPGHGR
jgi:hypothetical protein